MIKIGRFLAIVLIMLVGILPAFAGYTPLAEGLIPSAKTTNTYLYSPLIANSSGIQCAVPMTASGLYGLEVNVIGDGGAYFTFDSDIVTSGGITVDDGSGDFSAPGNVTSGGTLSGTGANITGTTTSGNYWIANTGGEVIDSDGDFIDYSGNLGNFGDVLTSGGTFITGDRWQSINTAMQNNGNPINPEGIATYLPHTPAHVTVGSSPFTFLNPDPYTLRVIMTNTVNMTIAIDGVTVSTGTSFFTSLSTNETLTITYGSGTVSMCTNAW